MIPPTRQTQINQPFLLFDDCYSGLKGARYMLGGISIVSSTFASREEAPTWQKLFALSTSTLCLYYITILNKCERVLLAKEKEATDVFFQNCVTAVIDEIKKPSDLRPLILTMAFFKDGYQLNTNQMKQLLFINPTLVFNFFMDNPQIARPPPPQAPPFFELILSEIHDNTIIQPSRIYHVAVSYLVGKMVNKLGNLALDTIKNYRRD